MDSYNNNDLNELSMIGQRSIIDELEDDVVNNTARISVLEGEVVRNFGDEEINGDKTFNNEIYYKGQTLDEKFHPAGTYVDTTTTQTIGGEKTFTDNVVIENSVGNSSQLKITNKFDSLNSVHHSDIILSARGSLTSDNGFYMRTDRYAYGDFKIGRYKGADATAFKSPTITIDVDNNDLDVGRTIIHGGATINNGLTLNGLLTLNGDLSSVQSYRDTQFVNNTWSATGLVTCGIKTSSSSVEIDSDGIEIKTSSSDVTTFVNGDTEIMRVNGDGVGIGTVSPLSPLHVYQDNNAVGNTAGLTIEQDGTGDALVQFVLSGSRRWVMGIDNSDVDKFKISDDEDVGVNTKFTIVPTTGNVGIGTDSPDRKLDVNGTAIIRDALTVGGDVEIYKGFDGDALSIQELTAGVNFRTFNTTPTEWDVCSITGYIKSNSGTNSGYPGGMLFKTKPPSGGNPGGALVDRMVIDANGNVGIGTTNPQAKLDVTGNAQIQGNLFMRQLPPTDVDSPNQTILFDRIDENGYANIAEGLSLGDIKFRLNENSDYVVGSIPTFQDYSMIRGEVDADGAFLTGLLQGGLSFWTRNDGQTGTTGLQKRMSIRYNGNVGIGTDSPDRKLDVNGTIIAQQVFQEKTATIYGSAGNTNKRIQINNNSFINGTGNTRYWKVATLPVSSGLTKDFVELKVVGGFWVTQGLGSEAPELITIKCLFRNRNGFTYNYSIEGNFSASVRLSVRVRCYDRSGFTDVYIYMAQGYNLFKYDIDGLDCAIIKDPEPVDAVVDTLIFDSGDGSTYSTNHVINCLGVGGEDREFIISTAGAGNDIWLLPSGNVGIGTFLTREKLDVNGSIVSTYAYMGQYGDNPAQNYAQFSHTNFKDNTTSYAIIQSSTGDTFLNGANGRAIRFRINNLDRMMLNSSGNFGINNISPAEKLDVKGNIRITNGGETVSPPHFRLDTIPLITQVHSFIQTDVNKLDQYRYFTHAPNYDANTSNQVFGMKAVGNIVPYALVIGTDNDDENETLFNFQIKALTDNSNIANFANLTTATTTIRGTVSVTAQENDTVKGLFDNPKTIFDDQSWGLWLNTMYPSDGYIGEIVVKVYFYQV